MRTAFFAAASAAALIGGAGAQTDTNTFLLDDVTLFDGDRARGQRDVLVEDGRIARVARRIRAKDGVTVVDGEGLYAIPGLIDAHVHAFAGSASRDALRFGVTTQLDQFTSPDFLRAEGATREDTDRTDKADFYSAGHLVTSEGGHGTQFGLPVPTIAGPEEAEQAVADRLEAGSDWIKIAYEPGNAQMASIDVETMKAVIDAAHAKGALAVVHVSKLAAARDALDAGADGLVHVFGDEASTDEFAALAKRSGAFVIATLAVNASVAGEAPGADAADDAALSPYLTAPQEGQLGATFGSYVAEGYGKTSRAAVRALHEAGVPIIAGSDAPNPGTTYGASLHTELTMLTEAGLTPAEALHAGTAGAADAFGIADRGRIAKGQKADILLLRADPTGDIRATRAIEAVYKNGFAVDRTLPEAAEVATATLGGDVIADFDEGLTTGYGAPVVATADDIAGGASKAAISLVPHGGGQALRVEGSVSAGFPYPWSGLGMFLSFDGTRAVDWSDREAFVMGARGDARPYVLMLFTKSSPQTPAVVPFEIGEDWGTVRVPLADARGADLAEVYGFAVTTGAPEGEVAFEVDDLRLE